MREAMLPPVWAHMQDTLRYVRRVSSKEYSAACPTCGGTVHEDGSWPDRLRIFCDDHPLAWCRRCGALFFPDQMGSRQRISHEELERWRQEQIAREEARKRSAERALQHLRDEELWLRFHQSLDATARLYWRNRGIPDEWQDRWCLGWYRHYTLHTAAGLIDTSAATIPLFDASGQVLNVKLRLINPPDNAGKYRYLVAGQSQPPFLTNYKHPLVGHVVAIEGELKAAVTYIHLEDDDAAVIGLPGASPAAHILAMLAEAERVTLVLDPGAEAQAWKLAQEIGLQRTRILILSHKIDDIILATHASPAMIRQWLAQAEPARTGRYARVA